MADDAGKQVDKPGSRIETLGFRRGDRGYLIRSRAPGKIVRAEALWADRGHDIERVLDSL